MKTLKLLSAILILFTLASCTSTNNLPSNYYASSPQTIGYQQFYDELSPYGRWVDYPGYGYVWRPQEAGFRPYSSNGHWAYTTYGWTWVSDYNWGWAPFHYGRWFNDKGNGWLWVPGYNWAPAWVNWRSNNEWYGWAPMSPGYDQNVFMDQELSAEQWNFIPHRFINERRLNNYYSDQRRNYFILNNTTIINNTPGNTSDRYDDRKVRRFYSTGPDAREVERETNQRIIPVPVQETASPDRRSFNDNTIHIYKPVVVAGPQERPNQAPKQIFSQENIKNNHEMNNNNMPTREFGKPSRRPETNSSPVPEVQPTIVQQNPRAKLPRNDEYRMEQRERNDKYERQRAKENTPDMERMPAVRQPVEKSERMERQMPVRTIPNNQDQQSTEYNRPSQQRDDSQGRDIRNMERTQQPAQQQMRQDNPQPKNAEGKRESLIKEF